MLPCLERNKRHQLVSTRLGWGASVAKMHTPSRALYIHGGAVTSEFTTASRLGAPTLEEKAEEGCKSAAGPSPTSRPPLSPCAVKATGEPQKNNAGQQHNGADTVHVRHHSYTARGGCTSEHVGPSTPPPRPVPAICTDRSYAARGGCTSEHVGACSPLSSEALPPPRTHPQVLW